MDDFAPLARRDGETAEDWGQRLVRDLAARHQRASPVPAEIYLQRLPGLEDEREVVLDLLLAEWTLRQEAEDDISLDEYLQRFPRWQQELREQWQIDRAASSEEPFLGVLGLLPAWYAGAAPLPAIFGAYRVLRELGNGGMARVFLAEPLGGGAAVALKVPSLPLGQDAKAIARRISCRERFRREARFMEQLEHPGLCQALDDDECEGLPFFTMPFYSRDSVGKELQERKRFPPAEAASLVAETARALQHAHDRGIVHRDLKPANLLRDEQGRIVVTDFGLAFPAEEQDLRLTASGYVPGTVLYFSPEQAAGQRNLTPASDVFSLGVVLYELLAGHPPFAGTPADLQRAISEATPAPLEQVYPDVSPVMGSICRRAMAREPGERYASMTDFADDLDRFLAGTWVRPPETPELLRSNILVPGESPHRSRRRWLVAGLSASAAVLLGGFALRAFLGGNTPSSPEEAGDSRPVVSTRQPVGLRGQLQLLHDDLDKLEATVRPHVRHVSLMAVHDNPYVSDADYALHLDALRRLLNRLSHDKPNVPVYPVGSSGCLLRIDLRDLAWDSAIEWSLLLQAEPYGVRYDAVHPDESLRKLARETYALAGINSLFDSPIVRADWLIVAASRAPLYDQLQKTDGKGRRTPPFDLSAAGDPIARVVHLYQVNTVDARVAAAELGLGTTGELDARWPPGKAELRKALDEPLPRSRWAGEEGQALFADCVRVLKLGVPRATQVLR